jgi:hypothetical protein
MKDGKQRKLAPNHTKTLLRKDNGDFVGCCDGITYGIDEGVPFNTGVKDYPKEYWMRWAKANALFYKSVSDRLNAYAEAVANERAR